MTPKQLAHEFFLGIRTAMTCPDVSVAEYEGVIADKIEAMLKEEREDCAEEALGAMSDVGTDDPHEALKWAADAIRKRGSS